MKRYKHASGLAVSIVLFWAIAYLFFAYTFAEPNPIQWHGFWRFMFASVISIIPFAIIFRILK
ncbi:hypothetical protein SAMN04488142_0014 [Halomonas sp. hl-4]|nr:hypothetical protein SAMN04488142_0014 [Halomonas sp. hl-4]